MYLTIYVSIYVSIYLSIRKKDDVIRSEKQRLDSVVRDLNKQIFQEKENVSKIRQDLTERPTIDDMRVMKRQLKVLQSDVSIYLFI
jgi:hypothetical protein